MGQCGAKIEADMQEMTDMVFEGLGAPEKIVMAPDVANAMLENSKYMKQFDMLSAKLGEINARYKGEGVRFLGYNADGVEMYSFSGKFLDDDGQMKPLHAQRHPHDRRQRPDQDAARPGDAGGRTRPERQAQDLHQEGSAAALRQR